MKFSPPRLLLSVLPALVLVCVMLSTIWGESGLIARHSLRADMVAAQDELARVERDNQRLLRRIRLMEQDPVVLRRVIADELGFAPEDAMVVRFEER